jgi:hypothetical protein
LQQEKIDDTRLIRSWDALFQCTSMNFFTQNFKNIFVWNAQSQYWFFWDWLARNRYNGSEWSDMSTYGLLFQWASTIKIQLSMLKINLFLQWYSWKIAMALNNNLSLTLFLTILNLTLVKKNDITIDSLFMS